MPIKIPKALLARQDAWHEARHKNISFIQAVLGIYFMTALPFIN
jgi:hypothetical protein